MTTLTPPALFGSRPVVGHALAFNRDPETVLRRGLDEHGGEPFALNILGKRFVVVLAPEHTRQFYRDRALTHRGAMPFFERMFMPGFLSMGPEQQYRTQRRLIEPLFDHSAVSNYLPTIEAETRTFIANLVETSGEEGEFDVEVFGPLILRIATVAFISPVVADDMDLDFFRTFRAFSDGMTFTPGWIPSRRNWRSRRAARQLKTALRAMIRDRRENPLPEPDFIQVLASRTYDDDTVVAEEVIECLLLVLAWAAHETTSAMVQWLITDLLQDPDLLARAREEADEALATDSPVDRGTIERMPLLRAALDETENWHAISPVLLRRAEADTTIGDYAIPAGTMVMTSPAMAHRLVAGLNEPAGYTPARFMGDDAKTLRLNLQGFGAGTHRCLGKPVAQQEIPLIIAIMLQAFDMTLTTGAPRPVSGATGSKWPQSPCRIAYRVRGRASAGDD
ncbi:cytochrome P450 [Nocardia tengchongensis]|uniref:cytochrome P450 n=1 Tax=Nocardia tengchongensis TaxID=2055889 RepID=UPI0036AFBC55